MPLNDNDEKHRSESKSSSQHHGEDLGEIVSTFKYNTKISPEFEKRFWDMFVVDAMIGNNDRHNRNWGFFIENNKRVLAPIFDNGNSFLGKKSDLEIENMIEQNYKSIISSGKTPFIYKDKKVDAFRVIKNQYLGDDRETIKALQEAIVLINTRLKEKMPAIEQLIDDIPETVNGLSVMSKSRKEAYKYILKERQNKILEPAATKILENQ